MATPSYSHGSRAEAIAIDPKAAARRAAEEDESPGRGFGLFAKLLAVGFWATFITLIVSAATAPGFAVFALIPLAGLPYLLFCFIAWTGDRNVE